MSETPLTHGVLPPRSVEQIVKQAQDFDHSAASKYSLTIILRTAQNILNQAANYERDDDLEQTYLFLYRHAEFCIARISSHADRRDPKHRQAVSRVTKQITADLARLEELKPELNRRHKAYEETGRDTNVAAQYNRTSRTGPIVIDSDSSDPAQRSDLALRLAHQRYRNKRPTSSNADLSRVFERLEFSQTVGSIDQPVPAQANVSYTYPSIPDNSIKRAPTVPRKLSVAQTPQSEDSSRRCLPPLPSKTPLHFSDIGPTVPPKTSLESHQYSSHGAPSPHLDPQSYTFEPTQTTEGDKSLRPVFLPKQLHSQFLSAASENTSRNLETCGILCATLISGALFVSHLVIPDQTSTSETCDTTPEGEVALFDYIDTSADQLLVCGWIHTHPTQTCFLSSRDLHTSLGYQVMLDESIAIVCAPRHEPRYGVFRLTDPPGVRVLSDCELSGVFHPHDVGGLYTSADSRVSSAASAARGVAAGVGTGLGSGHVSELTGLQFQIVDMRNRD